MTRTRRGLSALVGLLGLLAALLGWAHPAAAASPRVVFHLNDARIDEASGIAVGIRSPGVVYVQNDSGDQARFFALDAGTGKTLAVYDVPGATNHDWEDIAVAPDAAGVPSVWLADIGDNDAQRAQIQLYRVDEPTVPMGGDGASRPSSPPQVWHLRYPDGPHNAESLVVSPHGAAAVITKSVLGASGVYSVPAGAAGGAQSTLTKIGAITFKPTGTANPFSVFGQLTATGAALSRDGTLLAVRTYSDAYFWPVPDGDLARALTRAPTRVALPTQPQGEGIAFAGRDVLVDSEHVDTAVYSVPVPAAVDAFAATSGAATSGAATSGAAPSASVPAASAGASAGASAAASAGATPSPAPASRTPSSPADKINAGTRSAVGVILLFAVAGTWWLSTTLRNRTREQRRRRIDDELGLGPRGPDSTGPS